MDERIRYRRIVWAALLGALVLGVLAGGGGTPAPALADGFEFGCAAPEVTGNAVSQVGVAVVVTTQIGNAAPVVSTFDAGQILAGASVDADADAQPDLLLKLQPLLVPVANTGNFGALADRLGVSGLVAGAVLTMDRLHAGLAPLRATAAAKVDLTYSDASTSQVLVTLGYDSRAHFAPAPNHFDVGAVFQSQPVEHKGIVGMRHAAEYRVGGDPAGAVVPAGSQPGLDVVALIGTEAAPGETLDLGLGWKRTPAQFAVAAREECVPAVHQSLGWDLAENDAAGPAPAPGAVAPPVVSVDMVVGKTAGIGGHPEIDLHGRIDNVPEEATVVLTKPTVTVTHNAHGPVPTPVAPNLVLDRLVYATADGDPATPDTPTQVNGMLTGLPPATTVAAAFGPDGALATLDVRFCTGAWGSAECVASLAPAGAARLVISDLFPGEATTLPDIGAIQGRFVAYTSRDTAKLVSPGGPNQAPQWDTEKHFRFGADVVGPTHVNVLLPPPADDARTPPLAGTGVQVAADVAESPQARLLFDVDGRRTVFGNAGPKPTTKQVGSAFGFDGTLAPLPASLTARLSPTDAAPVDLTYDLGGTDASLAGSFFYRGGTDSDALWIAGKARLGEADGSGGLPSAARFRYYRVPGSGSALEQLSAPKKYRAIYAPNGPTHLVAGLVATTAADRAQKWRLRAWADVRLRRSVAVEWELDTGNPFVAQKPAPKLVRAHVGRFCATPLACFSPPGDTPEDVFPEVKARVVRQAIPPPVVDAVTDVLAAPALPAIQYPNVYPAFTDTPHGATVVKRDDGRWGAGLEIAHVASVEYKDTGTTKGQTFCLVTVAPSGRGGGGGGRLDDPRFGARVFVNSHGAGEAPAPVYADGVLSSLPLTVGVRLNDAGAKANPAKPWLWVHTKTCGGTALPPTIGGQETEGIDLRVLAKVGTKATQAALPWESLALGKPGPATPYGATVHALSLPESGLGIDVSGRILVPEQVVVYRPGVNSCTSESDPYLLLTCQAQLVMNRDSIVGGSVKFLTTAKNIGAVDAKVRLRSATPEAERSNRALCVGANCDTDVVFHLDNVPGQAAVSALLNTNVRAPITHVEASLANLHQFPQPGQEFGTAHVEVTRDARPTFAGFPNGADEEQVPNYAVDMRKLRHAFSTTVDFQGTESTPSIVDACPNKAYDGRGALDVGYVHVDLDVQDATTLVGKVRIDYLGRVRAALNADSEVYGSVATKVVNVGAGLTASLPNANPLAIGTSDIDLCIDLDVPLVFLFANTTDAHLSVDKTHFKMYSGDWFQGGKVSVSFGELLADGTTWVDGADWVYHYAHFDPISTGDWAWSAPGRRTLATMGIPIWTRNVNVGKEQFDDYYRYDDLSNYVGEGHTYFGWPNDWLACCTTYGGVTNFTIDPIWNHEIRAEMSAAEVPILGIETGAGWGFYKALWDAGHLADVDDFQLGALAHSASQDASSHDFHFVVEQQGTHDPERAKLWQWSDKLIQGQDGTKYQLYFGLEGSDPLDVVTDKYGNDVTRQNVPILSLVARYPNGAVRWVRQVEFNGPSCGRVYFQCDFHGTARFVGEGILRLSYRTAAAFFPFQDLVDVTPRRTQIWDTSGQGGSATARQQGEPAGDSTFVPSNPFLGNTATPTTLSLVPAPPASGAMANINGLPMKKVWYFGDGASEDQGVFTGAAKPASHRYSAPGTYGGMVVYYVQTSDPYDLFHTPVWHPYYAQRLDVLVG